MTMMNLRCTCGHDSAEHLSSYNPYVTSTKCTTPGCDCTKFVSPLEAWAKAYYEKHKCSRCNGTGVVPSYDPYEPGNVVCDDCRGRCIYGGRDEPSFDQVFADIKKVTTPIEIDAVITKYEKMMILHNFTWFDIQRGRFIRV
jgi:hypothetical protein